MAGFTWFLFQGESADPDSAGRAGLGAPLLVKNVLGSPYQHGAGALFPMWKTVCEFGLVGLEVLLQTTVVCDLSFVPLLFFFTP